MLRDWDVASGVMQSRKRSRLVFVEPLPRIMILEMEKQTSTHSERRSKEKKREKNQDMFLFPLSLPDPEIIKKNGESSEGKKTEVKQRK